MTPDVNVFLINMSINETISKNEDGTFSIFINARLSNDGQLRAYRHAMKHIEEEDFQNNNVQEIEAIAHNLKESNITPIPSSEYEERIKSLRNVRRRNQRKIREAKKHAELMQECGIDLFALAEQQKLYGDDL